MRLRSRPQRFSTWLAILAVLWMAFAPLASQALGAEQSQAWIEICGANGAKWVKANAANAGAPEQPQPGAHPLDHCPYCSLHASAMGMPPAALAPLALSVSQEMPAAFMAAPRTLHAWRSAQPRGPPALT